jgi:hypothetical protein
VNLLEEIKDKSTSRFANLTKLISSSGLIVALFPNTLLRRIVTVMLIQQRFLL